MSNYFKHIILASATCLVLYTIYKLYDNEKSMSSLFNTQHFFNKELEELKKKVDLLSNNTNTTISSNQDIKIEDNIFETDNYNDKNITIVQNQIDDLKREIGNIEQLISDSSNSTADDNSEFNELANIELDKNSEFNDILHSNSDAALENNILNMKNSEDRDSVLSNDRSVNHIELLDNELNNLNEESSVPVQMDENYEEVDDKYINKDNKDNRDNIIDSLEVQNSMENDQSSITVDIIINNYSKKELEQKCLDNNLSKTGSKTVLANRLFKNNVKFSNLNNSVGNNNLVNDALEN